MSEGHVHHEVVTAWFNSPGLQWALCALTEAGFLRNATAPRPGQIGMSEATAVLAGLAKEPDYRYVPITADWHTLTQPFSQRIYGTKQVTDAYLLGLAIREGLVLATMDKAILHLAGDQYSDHVLLLKA